MIFRKKLLVLLACSCICLPVRADELTQEKRADIERLLQMTGALSIGKQMAGVVMSSFTRNLKKARPDIPENVLNLLPAEVEATFDENMDALKEEIIPIYHRHFTGAEVKGMIQFYSTELGQKTVKVMPALMQEGMLVGQRWGQSLAPKINQRITSKLMQQGVKL